MENKQEKQGEHIILWPKHKKGSIFGDTPTGGGLILTIGISSF